MGKLINRIPGLPLSISSLPGSALRTHVESLGKPPDSTRVLEAMPGKLDIKRHSRNILYIQIFVRTRCVIKGLHCTNIKHIHISISLFTE